MIVLVFLFQGNI